MVKLWILNPPGSGWQHSHVSTRMACVSTLIFGVAIWYSVEDAARHHTVLLCEPEQWIQVCGFVHKIIKKQTVIHSLLMKTDWMEWFWCNRLIRFFFWLCVCFQFEWSERCKDEKWARNGDIKSIKIGSLFLVLLSRLQRITFRIRNFLYFLNHFGCVWHRSSISARLTVSGLPIDFDGSARPGSASNWNANIHIQLNWFDANVIDNRSKM